MTSGGPNPFATIAGAHEATVWPSVRVPASALSVEAGSEPSGRTLTLATRNSQPGSRSSAFSDALQRQSAAADLAPADAGDTAREAAQQLVASAFLLPLLGQLRNDPFKSERFHGGRAEEIFGQQLDTVLADRLAARLGLPVAAAIERAMRQQLVAGQRLDMPPAHVPPAHHAGRLDLHG